MRRRRLELLLAFIAGAGDLGVVAPVAGWWDRGSAPVLLNTDKVETVRGSDFQVVGTETDGSGRVVYVVT
jgi:hypothetical protein